MGRLRLFFSFFFFLEIPVVEGSTQARHIRFLIVSSGEIVYSFRPEDSLEQPGLCLEILWKIPKKDKDRTFSTSGTDGR